ncbi:hypothetical protein BFR69_00795 [Acinetobacter pittii]|uniref:hypothetical protein n=1 Tax=Acinetobacter pittii TaxID=48296 RepID=UPI0002F4D203|nr:hypothetical protein [Acinetobacter pittii]AUT33926.1 hypothetical protein C2U64_08790 [Acinetobacter pittii]KRI14818.1 hypothetical protein APC96_12400 [Acinetobacter pittii]MCE6395205.1 hypothetical protein [Acinetobacter pittii]OCY18600.1 hypothetical protein BFR64_15860 [Acinetobacter pittii]OCY27655.1 hypothetical protein BFR74_15115 [Acinetobacter pittii]
MNRDFEWLKWVGLFSVISIIGAVLYFIPNKKVTPHTTEQTSATFKEEQSVVHNTQEPLARSYSEVVFGLKSEVGDAVNEVPPVTLYVADLMAARNVKWDELNQISTTSYGKVMKDIQEEALKLLCSNGVVTEIYGFNSQQGNKFYEAGILDDSGKVYRVVAIGSSGNIEAESRVKFCGQVTGRLHFNNAIGGTTTVPFLVGMFDLPANK